MKLFLFSPRIHEGTRISAIKGLDASENPYYRASFSLSEKYLLENHEVTWTKSPPGGKYGKTPGFEKNDPFRLS